MPKAKMAVRPHPVLQMTAKIHSPHKACMPFGKAPCKSASAASSSVDPAGRCLRLCLRGVRCCFLRSLGQCQEHTVRHMILPLLASFIDLHESLGSINFQYCSLALFCLLLDVDILPHKERILLREAFRYYPLSVLAGVGRNEASAICKA